MTRPDPDELTRARDIIRKQPRAEAMLAFTADKGLLFSASGHAFLMYGKRGRSWVCLFDPVGPRTELGRASWRGRVCQYVSISVGAVSLKNKQTKQYT